MLWYALETQVQWWSRDAGKTGTGNDLDAASFGAIRVQQRSHESASTTTAAQIVEVEAAGIVTRAA